MFIGHYAVGLGAKRFAPKVSLGTLFLATQLIDHLWPLFVVLGLEHFRVAPGHTAVTPLDFYHYPLSHSLIGTIFWAALFGAVHFAARRDKRSAFVVAVVVVSHWLLDAVVHRPDLPLAPGLDLVVGLSLWNSRWGSILVEGSLYFAGTISYAITTRARNRIGRYGYLSLIAMLGAIGGSSFVGGPPPNEQVVIISAFAIWLFVFWAAWIDRHRTVPALMRG